MRSESKRWKLVKNKEVFDITGDKVRCEDCDSAIKSQTGWAAFQVKKPVVKNEFKDKVFYEYKTIVEFYCSDCAIEAKEDVMLQQQEQTSQTSTFEKKKDEEKETQEETSQAILVNEEGSKEKAEQEENSQIEKVETWNFEVN